MENSYNWSTPRFRNVRIGANDALLQCTLERHSDPHQLRNLQLVIKDPVAMYQLVAQVSVCSGGVVQFSTTGVQLFTRQYTTPTTQQTHAEVLPWLSVPGSTTSIEIKWSERANELLERLCRIRLEQLERRFPDMTLLTRQLVMQHLTPCIDAVLLYTLVDEPKSLPRPPQPVEHCLCIPADTDSAVLYASIRAVEKNDSEHIHFKLVLLDESGTAQPVLREVVLVREDVQIEVHALHMDVHNGVYSYRNSRQRRLSIWDIHDRFDLKVVVDRHRAPPTPLYAFIICLAAT